MSSFQRVHCALRREEPDRVPLMELTINPHVMDKIYPGCSYYNFIEQMDLDIVGINEAYDFRTDVKFIDQDGKVFKDKWGVVRKYSEDLIAYPIEGPIKSEADLKKYIPPDPTDKRLLGDLSEVAEKFKGKKSVMWLTHAAFTYAWCLRGMDEFLMDYILNPWLAKEITKICVEFSKQEVRTAIDAGADLVVLGDDYAYKGGSMMSPAHFEEFILPGLADIVHIIKKSGANAVIHSDGNIWPLIDMIVSTGIDAIHPIDPLAGMDIGEVKQKYGNKVCLIGNVDCGPTLSFGSRDEVVKATKECIRKASVGGGHILSSSNSIHASVKPENFLAMIETAKKYGRYPINSEALK